MRVQAAIHLAAHCDAPERPALHQCRSSSLTHVRYNHHGMPDGLRCLSIIDRDAFGHESYALTPSC